MSWCSVTSSIHSNQHPFIHLFLLTNRKAQSWPSPPSHLPLEPIHAHSLLYSTFLFAHSAFHSSYAVLWPQCMKPVQQWGVQSSIKRKMDMFSWPLSRCRLGKPFLHAVEHSGHGVSLGQAHAHTETHIHSKNEKTTQRITVHCSMRRQWRVFTSAMYLWFSLVEDSQSFGEWFVYPAIIQKEGITMVFVFHFSWWFTVLLKSTNRSKEEAQSMLLSLLLFLRVCAG